MKIVIDDKIPYIREAAASIADEVVYLKGSEIGPADVRDADALIVRTRTRCDRALLEGSRVKFVATATIGFDHIDTAYLAEAGIGWANCPGCNSGSVAQYVRSVLLLLERDFGVSLAGMTLGVVGCGHVGGKVRRLALDAGMRVLVSDPPVGAAGYVALEEVAAQADIITFHVPMVKSGPWPTWHLADEAFFGSLRRRPFIINTSRGAVVDNAALLKALAGGTVRQAVIDTWENEPDIDRDLLDKVYIGTPHIAGYSADGKTNADNMALEAVCRHFGLPLPEKIVPPELPADVIRDGNPLTLYNPLDDSRRLKENPAEFENLRGNYPLRRETF